MLDHLLASFRAETTVFGDDLAQDEVDFPGHVSCISADVEICLLLEEIADERCIFAQAVLDVDLLGGFTGEGRDDLQGVTKLFLEGLFDVSIRVNVCGCVCGCVCVYGSVRTLNSSEYKKSSSLLRQPKNKSVVPTFWP